MDKENILETLKLLVDNVRETNDLQTLRNFYNKVVGVVILFDTENQNEKGKQSADSGHING